MRIALGLVLVALVALVTLVAGSGCKSATKANPCDTVRVQVDGANAFELPARAEFCLYAPDTAACCKAQGASCEPFAGSGFRVFDVVRPEGCPAPGK